MATTIRLTRMGKKKRPFYRLVVLDSRKRRDGAYLANLGYYNPFEEPHQVKLHDDDIIAWLQKGAQMSNTARALLRSQGILYRFSLVKQGLGTDEIESMMVKWREGADSRAARWEQKRADQVRQAEAAKAEVEAAAVAETAAEAAAEEKAAEKAAAEAKASEADTAAEAAAGSDAETSTDAGATEAGTGEAVDGEQKEES